MDTLWSEVIPYLPKTITNKPLTHVCLYQVIPKTISNNPSVHTQVVYSKTDRHTDRRKDRRWTHRQTGMQADRKMDRQGVHLGQHKPITEIEVISHKRLLGTLSHTTVLGHPQKSLGVHSGTLPNVLLDNSLWLDLVQKYRCMCVCAFECGYCTVCVCGAV